MSESKRYTKQEVMQLVAIIEAALMKRRKEKEGLPWTYADLKSENKDLDFELIQKKIKNACGQSATAYFTERGYIYNPEKGYDEPQLKKLLFEFRNRKFKTLEAFIAATKKPDCFYDVESAISFIESTYHTSAVEYLTDKGILEPIAKQLALGGKTLYQFTEYSLPQREKVDGFKTEKIDVEEGVFKPIGIFACCLFKGFTEDIKALHSKYIRDPVFAVENTNREGISQVFCKDYYDEPYISDAIREFPQLKFLAFYKSYKDSAQIFTVYSESGYPFVTDVTCVGGFDRKSEGSWIDGHLPDSEFKYTTHYIAVGFTENGTYKCPYKKEWNALDYVVFEKDSTKIVVDSKEQKKESKKKQDLLQSARYPVTIYFDVYDTCNYKVGETLYLKKSKDEILLCEKDGRIIFSYSWIDIQFDAWECEPFNIAAINHIKTLGKELDNLSARVSEINDWTDKLGFYRVDVEIYLKE